MYLYHNSEHFLNHEMLLEHELKYLTIALIKTFSKTENGINNRFSYF